MAIMFVRAKVISRGAGRSVVSAAAYRHRTRMEEEQTGIRFRYEGGRAELVHEELAVPAEIPAWLRIMIDGETVAGASEALWNAVDTFEKRADAQLARELILALPEELSKAENIALVREFVHDHVTAKGMVADWVYHDKDGNPHIHLMSTLRPLTDDGFGPKRVPVLGDDGEPLRVVALDRPTGKILYRVWAGNKETMKAWKIAWAETANRHLALAGFDIRLDGRSYEEQGLKGFAQMHRGWARMAVGRSGRDIYFAPAKLARRQAAADRLADDPGLLLKLLSREHSTFDEREIAKALHRYVDDPDIFSNIRAGLLASPDLVTLKPQQVDRETGKVSEAAIFTTRAMLRVEHAMAKSAQVLAMRAGYGVPQDVVDTAILAVETRHPERPSRFEPEQVDAVHYVTADNAIAAIVGLAGTGKSTLLAVARLAFERRGRRVLGGALSGKAAEGLRESAGIQSRTLAAWELAWSNGRDRLRSGDVFIVDEAGMVSSEQLARILKLVETAGAKVVLVGDAMQLQPIQAGAAFRAIVERIGFAELSGVRRQRDLWAREATRLFARGEVELALDAYAHRGRIVETDKRQDAIERIVTDWGKACEELFARARSENRMLSGSELLILAQTNDDVRALNRGIRSQAIVGGRLDKERMIQTERGQRAFAVGDRLIFLENARFVEPRVRHLAFQYVKNGMLGTVMSTGPAKGKPLLSVRLDSGCDVVFSEDSYRNVDHGYAVTVHKSQGTTVDRTFVLATGLMDRHLAYVAMSRHRDRADLYMAREDFAQWPKWSKAQRVDHMAGVTGELIEMGNATYCDDTEAKESPYADIRMDDGSIHRVWGVSLPEAISKGGAEKGDTVVLRKDGIEKVTVRVPLSDPKSKKKKFEERTVNRNIWTAKRIETANERIARLEREGHRPDMFRQLVGSLSRSGAKSTTLDFENEDAYRSHVIDFARLRGMDHAAEMAAQLQAAIEQRLSWVGRQHRRVAELWERANIALGFAIERERSAEYNDLAFRGEDEKATVTNKVEAAFDAAHYLLPGQSVFVRLLEEDARVEHLGSRKWKRREEAIRPVLERIYRDPDCALMRVSERASRFNVKPREIEKEIIRDPGILGALKGSGHITQGWIARRERANALAAVAELVPLFRAHAECFKADAGIYIKRERNRRLHMAVPVPAFSAHVSARLKEIEGVRKNGGEGAYKAAFAIVASDRSVVQELKAVDEALTARFGWSAFTAKADEYAAKHMNDRMPEGLPDERREELLNLFAAVRRFCYQQYLAEKRDPSRSVAPTTCDPQQMSKQDGRFVLPMIAAAKHFAVSVEEEARSRITDIPRYRQERSVLADSAAKVWRDPAAALAMIEDLLRKGAMPERLARAVANDPSAYGALRGSGRILDRLNASGRERRAAIVTVETTVDRIRSLGHAWTSLLDAEKHIVEVDRKCMLIPIPGLSPRAEAVLKSLADAVEKSSWKLTQSMTYVDPNVLAEFKSVSKALDARFGRDAIASGELTAIRRIPAAQRGLFETILPRFKLLQQVVRANSAQEMIVEREIKVRARLHSVTR
ncbi:Ti-type conjugative transfer relaxase TraA [Aquamicrobium sp. LC103]|uniref:Ti-type conjugative transfer relaxase TraA n=1 Tax=Aquamicrobium sp. LC103 TaxID=1120658 RepID=UPI00063EB06D|nr:Ti-type conjugative transfer relaxase TraA [Aquamicrobium sp. LC103]TKT75904.1 Ti-type conjugative transfer relaxase TraA [Aquamicrobium sp. LC103]